MHDRIRNDMTHSAPTHSTKITLLVEMGKVKIPSLSCAVQNMFSRHRNFIKSSRTQWLQTFSLVKELINQQRHNSESARDDCLLNNFD